MIRKIPCTHKIGMCRCPYERFMYYQEQDWQPWLMCLLASTSTREAAYMLEASLIRHFETTGLNMKNNYNWTVSQDYGGEGPTHKDDAHNEHWVYVVLHPTQITLDDSTAVSAPALELPAEDPTADLLDVISTSAGSAHPPLEAISTSAGSAQNRSGPNPSGPDVDRLLMRIVNDGWGPTDCDDVSLALLLEVAEEYLSRDEALVASAVRSKLRMGSQFDWTVLEASAASAPRS